MTMRLPWRMAPIAGGAGEICSSLRPAEASALVGLAAHRRVLEIGSAYGYSAVRMAATADCILAVDPHEAHDSLEPMRANLLAFDARRRVTILVATSAQAFRLLSACGAVFDLVFIDGDHSAEAVRADVTSAQGVLAHGGVIACHDYGEETCPGVQEALDRLYPKGPDRLVDTLWITHHV